MSGAAVTGPAVSGAADRVAEQLQGAISGTVARDAPLAPGTSFRLGGAAAVLVEAASEEDLVTAGRIAATAGLEVLALGRGSNVLISDRGFPGVVVRLGKGFEWIHAAPGGAEAGGAAPLPRLANWAARRGLSGLEFAIAIPASLGGAVRMNAGAHNSSFSAVLESARIYHLGAAAAREIPTSRLAMGYRSTGLGPADIVCSARLRLMPADPAEIAERIQRFREHRAAAQPAEPRNAGSMFRNPAAGGPPAGRLIESAGLKGFRIGGAEVSARHANFFLARPGATAQDVYQLLAAVQARVQEASGVRLAPEVRLIGAFEGPELSG
ncbi:MAG: UDP-N-acetylmuramate dehydrogenase [Actinomycetota bacterium]